MADSDLVFAELSPRELAAVQQLVLSRIASSILPDGSSRLNLDPGLGVDAAIFKEAARIGAQVEGLETAADQLRLLSGPALSLQVLLLRDSIREYRYHADALLTLYRAYLEDNRTTLEREISASLERSGAFRGVWQRAGTAGGLRVPRGADFKASLTA
jgi:uncharacterized protein YbaP (TraB family)